MDLAVAGHERRWGESDRTSGRTRTPTAAVWHSSGEQFAAIVLASGKTIYQPGKIAPRYHALIPLRRIWFSPLCAFVSAFMALASFAWAGPNPRVTGTPFLTAWDADDYGGAAGNYHIVQSPQTGFVYIGNRTGVLEFDGASWRIMGFRDGAVVPIVVVDHEGAVWFGGPGEVAVLRPDRRGELQPVEMTDQLPAADRNFGRLFLGAAAPDGVYLASPSRLIFFGHDGTTRTWPSGRTNFSGLAWFDGALYASLDQAGLARLENGILVPVAPPPRNPNQAKADTLQLFALRASPDRSGVLLLTNIGPLRWAGRGLPMEPLSAAGAAEFARESATSAAFLPDGRLVFSLPFRGLVFLQPDGILSSVLDADRGLPRGQIDRIATDDQGGLWLAQVNGVARLQLESRYATHGGLDAARAFLRQGGRLYVGYYTGLSWRDDFTGNWHPVSGLPGGPRTLLAVGDRIFSTGAALHEITREDRALVALPLSSNAVLPLGARAGAFLSAEVGGLRRLQFDGAAWRDLGPVPGVDGSVRNLFADREGGVWATGYSGMGSWRLDFGSRAGADENNRNVQVFTAARGLPSVSGFDTSPFASLGGETVAIRGGQLLRYDRAAGRFVPEDRIDDLPRLEGAMRAQGVGDAEQWWFVRSPTAQLVHIRRIAENRWRAESLPTGPLHDRVPSGLYYDAPTQTIWFGDRSTLVSVDPSWHAAGLPASFHAVIRSVATEAGEVLWAGPGLSVSEGRGEKPLALTPTQNSLRFTFAAPAFLPDYRGAIRTMYRTRLTGLEKSWSNWSTVPWREFTSLPWRSFVLEVQARDIEERESTIASIAFSIAPPWWRSRVAFVGYAGATFLAIVGIFRFRTRALRRRTAQLELLVAARTAELERLRRLEMNERITAQLAEEKARLEVLRYQLNPHFLFNSLNSIYALIWSQSRPAGDLVRRLAEFCRMTLTRRTAELATIAEEFAVLRAYLELEQVRWQEKLQVEFALDPAVEGERLPPFLLLPLVENAIKYGGHTCPDVLHIRVAAHPVDMDWICIEIANSGSWVEPGSASAIPSSGIGLDNLRQRLARHYPGRHEIAIGTAGGWVTVRLRLSRSGGLARAPEPVGASTHSSP